MYFHRREPVQRFHDRLVRHLHCLLDILSFDKLCRHTAGRHCRAAAEGFELYIADDLVLIDIEIDPHDVAALCIADRANTAGVFDFSHVSRMLEMIHYFFCIHLYFLLVCICFFTLCLL